ncbi:MAG: phosphodiester glycosidase family protein, partial [Actinobacteria bacterium]|nr:phosphodiester glycosidase family protein [Actinomycetota bacterium]
MAQKKRLIILGAGLAVLVPLGGGTAWALDRYLIPHVEISDVQSYEAENSTVATTATDTDATEPTITVSTVVTGTGSETVTYYVADVTLTDATQLRSAFADNSFGENITALTSEIAAANDAVFAINGDYYGFRDTGIEIRNGVIYR